MTPSETIRSDHDAFWKEAFDCFLSDLVQFFAADLYVAIDWSKGFKPIDPELLANASDAETGSLLPDRVYEVWLASGESAVLFLHFEFQSSPDADFGERMFTYRARLWLKLRKPIVSIALLADGDPRFRPTEFRREEFGNELYFQFRSFKLLDHAGREEELLRSGNIAAVLVAIKLIDARTRHSPTRYAEKLRVLRMLAALPLGIEVLRRLTKLLVEGIMLPLRLNRDFHAEVRRIEEAIAMPFTTIYEREAREEGRVEGAAEGLLRAKRDDIARILWARFGTLSPRLEAWIPTVSDVARLDALIGRAATSASLADFERDVG